MRPLKILIVDDTAANAKLAESVVVHMGHTAVLAENGQVALERFEAERPDLVLMDVMMPVMDGITATREIRTRMQHAQKWVPILVLSALDAIGDIVRGLEAGADDYIVKPVSVQLLRAKINSFGRQLSLQDQVLAYTGELETWRSVAQEQSHLGAHVMDRLINTEGLRDAALQHFNIPAETFSGDLICAARTPDNVLHLLLADATGHGLPAALSAIPVAHAFYRMTEKGFPLPSIVKEMNAKLKAFLPADRFVAATLASVDVNNQTIEIWNGGNPSALLFNEAGEVVHEWVSKHPPLGVMPPQLFTERTETIAYSVNSNLLLCSDGLVEAENANGDRLDLREMLHTITGVQWHDRMELMRELIAAHISDKAAQDDISSILTVTPVERRQIARAPNQPLIQSKHPTQLSHTWRLELSYGASELRYLDVVPGLLSLLTQVQALTPHQGALFLIVSELFNNALDHGLLGLDSELKSSDGGGFEQYMQQREERLNELEHGRIDLSFLLHHADEGPALDISISDTGDGFDYSPYLRDNSALEESSRPHGRGIALVRNLCVNVRYLGNGNTVTVRYLI